MDKTPIGTIMIRAAGPDDTGFMTSMLVAAMNWSPDRQHAAGVILSDPQVAKYIIGWPQPGDRGLIATDDEGAPLGACWLRYRSATEPGYGFLSADIAELTIAVQASARGNGIGRALLHALTADARAVGITRLSLSVEHGNPAAHLYRSEGWRTVQIESDADTMLLDLAEPFQSL